MAVGSQPPREFALRQRLAAFLLVELARLLDAQGPLDEGQPAAQLVLGQIGRASCRERVCQYVSISVVAVSLKKNRQERQGVDKEPDTTNAVRTEVTKSIVYIEVSKVS